MKNYLNWLATTFVLVGFSFGAAAQFNITSAKTSGNWADYYVNNVLLGTGVTAFNITFTGADTVGAFVSGLDSAQIAEFTSATPTVQIPYGLLLSTGSAEAANANNPSPPIGPGGLDFAGDPDLDMIVTDSVHNRAILEFDFVPQGDTIKFNYVFGSVEYPGFVCSNFNDVFGFFLSGPGINGPYTNNAENLALVPGTTTPVAINTINDVAGGSACATPCPCNSQYFVNNYTAPTDTNNTIPGLTVNLQAIAQVNCGDTYHIKMAIADVGDGSLDSYVFLEGGSFTSNVVEVAITSVNGDTTINEGCGQADIRFFRTDTADTSITPLIITGTATNGTDYTFLPDSIMLLPGQADTTVSILPFFDSVTEGMEYLNIQAISINPCGDTFISEGTLYFFDIPNLHIKTTDSVFTCPVDSVVIEAEVISGGPPPYTYSWSNGMTGPVITIPAIQQNGSDTLILTVQDSCALFSVQDTVVYFRDTEDPPVVTLFPDDKVVPCAGDTVQFVATTQFGNFPLDFLWSTADTTDTILLSSMNNTNFTVTVTDSCGQTGTATGAYNIFPYQSTTVAPLDTVVNCPGTMLTLMPDILSGIGPQTFSWDKDNFVFDDSLDREVVVNEDTVVYLSLLDVCGITHTDSFLLEIKDVDPIVASMEGAYLDCPGDEALFAPTVTGGLYPYTYEWNVSDTTDSVVIVFPEVNTDIIVTVYDLCERSDTAIALADVIVLPPLEMSIDQTTGLCFGEETILNVSATGGAGRYVYDWQLQNPPLSGEIYEELEEGLFRVVPWQNTTHLLTVTDRCANSVDSLVNLVLDPCVFISNVLTPNGDGKNDAFLVPNIEAFPDVKLVVYNRWGKKIFEEQPYRNSWAPTNESSGTYFYVLESEYFGPFRGTITIMNDK